MVVKQYSKPCAAVKAELALRVFPNNVPIMPSHGSRDWCVDEMLCGPMDGLVDWTNRAIRRINRACSAG